MRKLIGTLAIVICLIVYALIVAVVAIKLELSSAGQLAAFAFYAIAGLSWVLPVGYIIWWMERGPPAQ